MLEFIKNKVYCKIFDRNFKDPTFVYTARKDFTTTNEEIQRNKNKVLNYMNASEILLLNQVHGNDFVDADYLDDFLILNKADAMITSRSKVVLAVQTADCVPVLLASGDGGVIAAAHCGWRSSRADILDKLVSSMRDKGATNIKAIIGPAIQQNSYEVDQLFYDDFLFESDVNKIFFIDAPQQGHYFFDLPSYVEQKLKNLTIDIFLKMRDDTYMDSKYPSYRRSKNSGEIYNQTILSTIMATHH